MTYGLRRLTSSRIRQATELIQYSNFRSKIPVMIPILNAGVFVGTSVAEPIL